MRNLFTDQTKKMFIEGRSFTHCFIFASVLESSKPSTSIDNGSYSLMPFTVEYTSTLVWISVSMCFEAFERRPKRETVADCWNTRHTAYWQEKSNDSVKQLQPKWWGILCMEGKYWICLLIRFDIFVWIFFDTSKVTKHA